MASSSVPGLPTGDVEAVRAWTAAQLGDLTLEGPAGVRGSPRFRGGQAAATARLLALDIRGYAARRNQVLPEPARGASAVSPYVRHGLIGLGTLWDHVAGAPARDRTKYRDELLWQEYARHLYARMGASTRSALRFAPSRAPDAWPEAWPRQMACVTRCVEELERDGWLVNQTRMWMSSQWTVRAGWDWRAGEDRFFAHLLDGSRAANRLGWQWTVGAGTGRPYSFTRWQVLKRAPGLCDRCARRDDCPIEEWPAARREPGSGPGVDPAGAAGALLRRDPDPAATAGPSAVQRRRAPDVVWLPPSPWATATRPWPPTRSSPSSSCSTSRSSGGCACRASAWCSSPRHWPIWPPGGRCRSTAGRWPRPCAATRRPSPSRPSPGFAAWPSRSRSASCTRGRG